MSSKMIYVCDICGEDTNYDYWDMKNNDFGIDVYWQICDECMDKIRISIKNTIEQIKNK